MLEKILISRCFLGDNVRYDNKTIPLKHALIDLWLTQNRLVSVCPEVSGGLSVPREPAEQQENSNRIITVSGIDVSQQFNRGAKLALTLCHQHNIRFAVLKESSPSCGSSLIYDGSFTNTKIAGQGVTSKLLRQEGIEVFSEDNLQSLANLLDK